MRLIFNVIAKKVSCARIQTHTHTHMNNFRPWASSQVDVVFVVVIAVIIMNISRLRILCAAMCLFPYASNYLEALCGWLLSAILLSPLVCESVSLLCATFRLKMNKKQAERTQRQKK